ncbi:hypothetical protein R3W88_008127 [Solanum pinnatisectum]|uniref:Aspartic peptidase DDI1-type domain-containing protein n=1 Tax=Solanum pinnatisectum TaxID=50273 RepID=A0AAV9M7E2_9SOLN|nr:hypothetical protein R3W88_008127 [Solanum pinnatisectum]
MPGYAKFMKEIVTKKCLIDCETIKIPQTCSAIMTNNAIVKKDDPGAFTIPCTIGMHTFTKALCDLGASINLIPLKVFNKLGLEDPKLTNMRLLMKGRTIKRLVRVVYYILVKIDKFLFPTNFVVLDCKICVEIPIILGRPFLASGKALVDIEKGELKFRVNEEEVNFNICKS